MVNIFCIYQDSSTSIVDCTILQHRFQSKSFRTFENKLKAGYSFGNPPNNCQCFSINFSSKTIQIVPNSLTFLFFFKLQKLQIFIIFKLFSTKFIINWSKRISLKQPESCYPNDAMSLILLLQVNSQESPESTCGIAGEPEMRARIK